MYDMNEGLGAAMAEAHARDRLDRLEKRVTYLEEQVRELEIRNAHP